MRLILIPLAILIILSIFSILGLGQELNTDIGAYASGVSGAFGNEPYIYDNSGTAIGQCLGNGTIKMIYPTTSLIPPLIEQFNGGAAAGAAVLINGTGTYFLYWDNAQAHQILYNDIQKVQQYGVNDVNNSQTFFLNDTTGLGFFGLVGAMMVAAVFIGGRVLGIGVSEESVSVLLKGGGWTVIWLTFSALAYPLVFGTGEMLLYIFWFVLTVVFTLGCINSFGHPGND